MENPALYHRSNEPQRIGVKELLDEYSHLLRWRYDGNDSLLDIGCGPGDVLVDYILPLLPSTFRRLVGADISDEMLRLARENVQHTKVEFRKLDIGVPLTGLDFGEPFDHITSFFCLHWVNDQEQAIKNIYDLLSPEGNCLVGTMAGHPMYEIFKRMSVTSKWSPYMSDVELHNFPYQHSETPADDFKQILQNTGFKDFQVTLHHKQYAYNGKKALKDFLGSVTLFLKRMSPDLQDEFIDEVAANMPRLDGNDSKILNNYKFLAAYARK